MNGSGCLARLRLMPGLALSFILLTAGCSLIGNINPGGSSGGGGNNSSSVSASAGAVQFAPVSTAFSTALQATVKDASGNALPNVTVTFAGPTSGASGSFAGGSNTVTATTDSTGLATAPAFTANSISGSYSVVASVNGGAGTASYNLTNTDVTGNWGYGFLLADGTTATGTLALKQQGASFSGIIYDPGVQVGDITGTIEPNGTILATWSFTTYSGCQNVTISTTSVNCGPTDLSCFSPGYGGPETGLGSVTSITSANSCSVTNQHGSMSMTYNPLTSPGLNLSGAWNIDGTTLASLTQRGQNVTGSALAQDGTLDSVSGTISGTAVNLSAVSPNGCTVTVAATEAAGGSSFSGTGTDAGSSCTQTGSRSISATRLF